MKNKLYILPSFYEDERITSTIYRYMLNHRKINKLMSHEFIPKPEYELLTIDEVESEYDSGFTYPENAVYRVASESGHSIQSNDLSHSHREYETLLAAIKKHEKNDTFYHSSMMDQHTQLLKDHVEHLEKAANVLPVLCIDYQGNFSLDGSHVKSMGEEDLWVEGIIRFLKQLTEVNIVIDHTKISYDSFLFYRDGRIARFNRYDSLIFYDESVNTLDQNIKVLTKLLYDFYHYYDSYMDQNPEINHYNSKFSKLYQRIHGDSETQFISFDEILAFFHGEEMPNPSSERIGVFVDVANIYTELKNLHIDYHKLLTTIYGVDNARNIKDKFAFFFEPTYESKKMSTFVKEKQETLKKILRDQGFNIDTSSNNQAKAKQLTDGEEHDEDDFRLIQRMEERLPRLTSVLLLSGDDDYYDILTEYKDNDRKVKVVSTHPCSTSESLVTAFDHSFITDYWDCILF